MTVAPTKRREQAVRQAETVALRNKVAELEARLAENLQSTTAAPTSRAQMYLNIAGTMIVVLDSRGRLTLVNKKGCEVLGCNGEELLGQDWFERCVPAEHRPGAKKTFRKLMLGAVEHMDYYEIPILTKTGNERLVAWHNAVLRDETGAIVGTLSSGQDITEHRQMEVALRQKERMEAVGQLAEGVARQFNSLLSTINGHASVVVDSLLPNTAAHHNALEIVEATRRAADLTRRLMNVAQAANSNQQVHPESTSLAKVTTETRELVDHLLAGKNTQIRILNPEKMPHVLANCSQLMDVLMNIFLGAADAMPQGGTVTVDADERETAKSRPPLKSRRAGFVGLRIQAAGPGMSEETLRRAFEPFFTIRGSDAALGWGLPVAQSIIQGMGGWMDLQAEKKAGAVLRIFLPKVPSNRRDRVRGGPERRGHTILLVDDTASDLAMMREALERAGHAVVAADSAEAGVSAYRRHARSISLAVVDFMLPLTPDKVVFEEILTVDPQAKVILTSGFSRDYVRGRVGPGSWAFLQKPFGGEQLLEVVNAMVNPA